MYLLALLLSAFLATAPGAYLAFTLAGGQTPFATRISLAIVLSPFVVGVQILLLAALGLSFPLAAGITLILNLPGLYFIWRARPRPFFSSDWITPSLCALGLAAILVGFWIYAPGFRIYSWHNMMQAEAIYQVAQLPRLPEEVGLAGVGLNYAWFGHVQIAAIGRLADVSPFLVFPILNVASLVALFFLALEAVRRLAPDMSLNAGALLTAAALLSPNLAGIVLDYFGILGGAGDLRASTPVHKFMHFDLMSTGVALLMATIVLALSNIDARSFRIHALSLCCLAALGLIYPLLFPAAFIVTSTAIVTRIGAEWWNGRGLSIAKFDWIAAAAMALPLAVWAFYLRLLGDGVASVSAELAQPWQMRTRLIDGALRGMALWAPLLAVAVWRVWKMRDAKRLTLLLAGAASGAMYLLFTLPGHVQYKFLVAAELCLLPLVLEQAFAWLSRLGRAALAGAVAIAAAITALVIPHLAQSHIPWRLLAQAEPLNEAHFTVSASTERFAWTNAVRERTPRDTIVVHPAFLAPVDVFTQRVSLVAQDPPDAERPGYTMLARGILEDIKGYPREMVDQRVTILEALYASNVDYTAAHANLVSFRRPLAIYLPLGSGYLAWLQARNEGEALYADSEAVVWIISPAAAPPATP